MSNAMQTGMKRVSESIHWLLGWLTGVTVLVSIALAAWLMAACAVGGAITTLGPALGILSVIGVGFLAAAVPALALGTLGAFAYNHKMFLVDEGTTERVSHGLRLYTVWALVAGLTAALMIVYAHTAYAALLGPLGATFGLSHAAPVATMIVIATVLATMLLLSQMTVASLRTKFGELICMPLPPFGKSEAETPGHALGGNHRQSYLLTQQHGQGDDGKPPVPPVRNGRGS